MENTNGPFGYELILDLYGCSKRSVYNQKEMYQFILELVNHLEMETAADPVIYTIDENSQWPDKAGITAFCFLITSSVVIHTLPNGYVALNVFSCKEFHPEPAKQLILNYFETQKYDWNFIKRGTEYSKSTPNH